MIDIDTAIIQSKGKENISDGGSKCFDFGDVVLVKYSCPKKYLTNGEHTRSKSEEIMEAINIKNKNGVNTPRHLSIKRVIEDEDDICYVLQQKSPGINCAKMYKYGASFEKMCKDLKFVLNIPFEHYKKLIEDSLQLFEMGYEAKNKNLFYDSASGFWFIDFLDNEKEYPFNENDITKVFEALNYRMPKPLQLASQMNYDSKLTPEQQNLKNSLTYAIKAKTLLATRTVLPSFKKYEKFFLSTEKKEYKEYLMREGIVDTNLMELDESDYKTFDELYEVLINNLIDEIVNNGKGFGDILVNEIRNRTIDFKLNEIWKIHKYNIIDRKNFRDEFNFEYEVSKDLNKKVLIDLINRLKQLEQNKNIKNFLTDASEKMQIETQHQKIIK